MTDEPVRSIQDFRDQAYAEDEQTRQKAGAVSKALGNDTLVAANVLAKAVANLPYPTMGIENALERFWGDWIRLYVLPDMEEVYQTLINKSVLESTTNFDFFYVPCTTMRVVAYPSNFNILFLWNASGFHLRRYWSEWTELQEEEGEDPADYSDHFPGSEYVARPDLKWYKNKQFVLEYGDSRDTGYIGSYNRLSGRVDKAISHHTLLKIALACYVPSLAKNMLNREAVGPWQKVTDLGG